MNSTGGDRKAKRALWALVIGIVVLNVVLFLVYSRSEPPSNPPTGTSNPPTGAGTHAPARP